MLSGTPTSHRIIGIANSPVGYRYDQFRIVTPNSNSKFRMMKLFIDWRGQKAVKLNLSVSPQSIAASTTPFWASCVVKAQDSTK
jgi:hypothetical protein